MKVISAFVAFAALVFFFPLIGVLGGAFAGWVVGLFFSDTILSALASFGVKTEALSMWQLGAMLGFVGSFFRSSVTK